MVRLTETQTGLTHINTTFHKVGVDVDLRDLDFHHRDVIPDLVAGVTPVVASVTLSTTMVRMYAPGTSRLGGDLDPYVSVVHTFGRVLVAESLLLCVHRDPVDVDAEVRRRFTRGQTLNYQAASSLHSVHNSPDLGS